MTAFPSSLTTREQSGRSLAHSGVIVSVDLLDGGTNPGPSSKMSYTVDINGIGRLSNMRPARRRWDDTWDVDALKPGDPVDIKEERGVLYLMDHEDRHAEECD